MLEFVEASLDAVALLVQFAIVAALVLAVAFWRDHSFCAECFRLRDQNVGIVAAVGEDGFGLLSLEQLRGRGIFPSLSGRDAELQRQAVLIRKQMDFGAQTSSGTPQSRVFGAPFLRPVAACW